MAAKECSQSIVASESNGVIDVLGHESIGSRGCRNINESSECRETNRSHTRQG